MKLKKLNNRIKDPVLIMFGLIVIVLMGIIFVDAVDTLGTFEKGKTIELLQVCDNCTYINISSVKFPNSTKLDINSKMTELNKVYNYTFLNTNALGDYFYTTCGNPNGIVTCESVNFIITNSGNTLETGESIIYIIFIGLLMFIFLLLVYGSLTNMYGIWIRPFGPATPVGTVDITNSYGIVLQSPNESLIVDHVTNDYGIYQMSSQSRNYFEGRIGIGNPNPTYPLEVLKDVSDISIYASKNISATGYITRTSTYDKSKGKALDKVKDADVYKNPDGSIKHDEFYGYVSYDIEKSDINRPVVEVTEEKQLDKDNKTHIIKHEMTTYPYKINVTEEGVSLDMEIDMLRQAVYELKIKVAELEKAK